MNPLGLSTPPNNPIGRVAEMTGRFVRAAYKRYGEYNDRAPRKKQKVNRKRKMKISKGYGSGYFKGSFAKARTVQPKMEDIALTYGSGITLETHGSCSGTEIVWVGASTLEITQMAKCVSIAILRKLYKIAGIDITNPGVQFLSLDNASGFSSGGFRIVRFTMNSVGTPATVSYDVSTAETLTSLALNSGLQNEIINFASTTSDLITTVIRLYQIDNTASTNEHRTVATLNMNNEMLHLEMKQKLVVQNRTKGATGTATSLDVIDAQPLKGKMYMFSKGNPNVRELSSVGGPPNTESLLGRWSNTSVKLVSDTNLGYDSNLKNPPSPYFFNNCKKASNITLEPGDLKEVNMKNNINKYYPQFLRSLAWFSGTGIRRQTIGDSVFVCLEERLNSGSSNPITVQYEAENSFLAYLSTNRIDPMVKVFDIQTISH